MYEKVSTSLDFAGRELEVLEFWKKHDVFNQSIDLRKEAPLYTFYDGPPTANGKPHIGHMITRAVKDLVPRYKTMKGYRVPRKAGWDTHGLPVELEVEKELGISGKNDIEKYGIEPFINKCKDSVWKYETHWREVSERVGFWADMDKPYVTYHNPYIESVWWALKKIWEKGLIYKGYRVVPYCPRCGTPLSSHEVAQGYKNVKETSVYVKFKAKTSDNANGPETYFLAWTTTPWTLPSNVGLCINSKVEYAKVLHNGEIYIMAKALLEKVFGQAAEPGKESADNKPYEIIETLMGENLNGARYHPLFDFTNPGGSYCTVVCDDYVTLTDGTGIVHMAPAFGEDDSRVCKAYNLPFIQLVDPEGKFTKEAEPWAGIFVKKADPLIVTCLSDSGKLFKKEDYEHSYPYCWRCDTPLIYYAREAWFIEMTKLRENLIKNNNSINWMPDNVRTGRFGNFVENVVDWSLSRERYWGTPLPIWECTCGTRHCIGSIAELNDMGLNVPEGIELHKPYIDEIKLICASCKGEMTRTPEVIDCWFDAGSMPFAQWHYPFENEDEFKAQFPADFISEAVDQTRGWFYTLLAISTLLFDCPSFKNVIVLGLVQNKDGQKMSKSKGDKVDPMEELTKHGADAVRWYFYINSAPWLASRYFDDAVKEAQRKFMGTLWNTYAFYVLYAEIDKFNPYEHKWDKDTLPVMDLWILSKLNSLIGKVDNLLENLELTEAARTLNHFTDEASNWYVRRCRERYWANGMPRDKINAYLTLHHVLVTVAKLAAPFVPFMTEAIYRNLVYGINKAMPISVHLCDYPVPDNDYINTSLETDMDMALQLVTMGRAARNASNIKNRQPLSDMYVSIKDQVQELDGSYINIIQEELNIKNVEFIDDDEQFVKYNFKPQLRTLGPKYGKIVPKITEALNLNPNKTMEALRQGNWEETIEGIGVVLTIEDVLVETLQKEGYMTQHDKNASVVIKTFLTPELVEEGFTRELVSKIQTMRKEAGFLVTDRIKVGYDKNEKLAGVIERNKETIQAETLANHISTEAIEDAYQKEWNINGEAITLCVSKCQGD